MVYNIELSFINLASTFEQHTQVPSDAFEVFEPNKGHIESDFRAMFVNPIGVTWSNTLQERDKIGLTLEIHVYLEVWKAFQSFEHSLEYVFICYD